MPSGNYTFDEEGRMVNPPKDAVVPDQGNSSAVKAVVKEVKDLIFKAIVDEDAKEIILDITRTGISNKVILDNEELTDINFEIENGTITRIERISSVNNSDYISNGDVYRVHYTDLEGKAGYVDYAVKVYGDVNCNGRITAADASEVEAHRQKVSLIDTNDVYRYWAAANADPNQSGTITMLDASYIIRKIELERSSTQTYTSVLK